MNAERTVLLTGASGVIGRALIEELAGFFDLVGLRHRNPIGDPRIRELSGDLTRPGLGLDGREARRLGLSLSAVVHCGAVTNWTARPARILSANVEGTANLLEFARHADVPVYHLSTAFVARRSAQSEKDDGLAAYLASKAEAEHLVRDSGHPAVILRPSVVIGASADGRIAAFQGLHQLIAMALRGELSVLPAGPGALIDVIPQDVMASAVHRLLRDGVTSGEFWLTSGSAALELQEVVDVTAGVGRRLGIGFPPPRMLAAAAVDRLLLPLMEDVVPPRLRRRVGQFLRLLTLFQSDAPLPSSLVGDAPLDGIALDHELLLTVFERNVEYWAACNGLTEPGEVA